MATNVDRVRFTRDLRFALGGMFLTVVGYGALVSWLLPAHRGPFDAAGLMRLELALVGLGLGLLLVGLAMWQRTPTEKMKALSAQKHGKAEREAGLPPRAQALRGRLFIIAALFESPAVLGLVYLTLGGAKAEVFSFIGASLLTVGWLYLRLPQKVDEVLG